MAHQLAQREEEAREERAAEVFSGTLSRDLIPGLDGTANLERDGDDRDHTKDSYGDCEIIEVRVRMIYTVEGDAEVREVDCNFAKTDEEEEEQEHPEAGVFGSEDALI